MIFQPRCLLMWAWIWKFPTKLFCWQQVFTWSLPQIYFLSLCFWTHEIRGSWNTLSVAHLSRVFLWNHWVGIFWTFEIGMLSNFKSDPVGFFEKNHVQGCLGQKCPKWGKKTCSTKNPFCCQFIVLETNQLKLAKNIPFLLSPKIGISQYHWDIWRNFS